MCAGHRRESRWYALMSGSAQPATPHIRGRSRRRWPLTALSNHSSSTGCALRLRAAMPPACQHVSETKCCWLHNPQSLSKRTAQAWNAQALINLAQMCRLQALRACRTAQQRDRLDYLHAGRSQECRQTQRRRLWCHSRLSRTYWPHHQSPCGSASVLLRRRMRAQRAKTQAPPRGQRRPARRPRRRRRPRIGPETCPGRPEQVHSSALQQRPRPPGAQCPSPRGRSSLCGLRLAAALARRAQRLRTASRCVLRLAAQLLPLQGAPQ